MLGISIGNSIGNSKGNLGYSIVKGRQLSKAVTFSRESSATQLLSASTLEEVGSNVARFSYSSTYLSRVLLLEGSRTNGIRNNTNVGAVSGDIGSGGALPTNYGIFNDMGLNINVDTTTIGDIDTLRLRISGTPTSSGDLQMRFDTTTGIPASSGEDWTISSFLKISSGSLSNISLVSFGINEHEAGGAFVAFENGPDFKSSLGSSYTRPEFSHTLDGGVNTARVLPLLNIRVTSGQAVDITLDIGLPQMEEGDFATSPIKTSGSAAARADEVFTIENIDTKPWFNPDEGTLVIDAVYNGTINTASGRRLIEISNGASSLERIGVGIVTGGDLALFIVTGGVSVASITGIASPVAGTRYRIAIRYRQDDYAISVNGNAVATDTSGNLPNSLTLLTIGNSGLQSGAAFSSYKSVTYLPAMSDEQLRVMSAL